MGASKTILAIDDEPRNLKILEITLGSEWQVFTASSGEEGLEKARSIRPDLILLDIMMPGMNGYEVCRQIREGQDDLRFTKIILVSGKAMIEEKLKGYEAGADDYVTKPFVPDELLAKAKVFMKLSFAEQELSDVNDSLEKMVELKTTQLLGVEAMLLEKAKMASLGQMAGGIAHEINTPLMVIGTLGTQIHEILDEIKVELFDKSLISKRAIKIVSMTERIAKIIQGLRTFARDDSQAPPISCQLNKIVTETLDLCSERFRNHGIALEIGEQPEGIEVVCRPTQVSQAFLNLLNNAFDAVEKKPDPWVRVAFTQVDGFVSVHVTDCGLGIDETNQAKLFQPFFTTKEIGRGTGLGLSISRGIMESNGGDLSYNRSSKNTSFTIKLIKHIEAFKSESPMIEAVMERTLPVAS